MTTRIAAIPERDWREGASEIAQYLTQHLRRPSGTLQLRPIQGVSLFEGHNLQGLFCNARTGAGKTLITGLLPVVLNSRRPLLLVPAALVTKTLEDFESYRPHFPVPKNIRIVSYSKIGMAKHAKLIEAYEPDLIMADEGHKLRNYKRCAAAARVLRYMTQAPATRFAGFSATFTKGSLIDYAHLLYLALRQGAPVPINEQVLLEWCEILDAKADPNGFAPLIPTFGEIKSVTEARTKFMRRLTKTPGVIISPDSFDKVPLKIRNTKVDLPPEMETHLDTLRTYWETPDGWSLADARFEVWHVARQLALGFCYIHDPRPPKDWWDARRAWGKFCRAVIEDSDQYDTEFQVAGACECGALPDQYFRPWQAIKPTFKPNTVPMWLSHEIVKWVAMWGMRNPHRSLIWVEHRAFGELLSYVTGWPYFREKGLDASGRYIECAHNGKRVSVSYENRNAHPAIVSVEANNAGRNLQYQFNHNLIVSPKNDGNTNEQMISRTHRDGQEEPVTVEQLIIVQENRSSVDNARREAHYIEETTNQAQKLLIAERW